MLVESLVPKFHDQVRVLGEEVVGEAKGITPGWIVGAVLGRRAVAEVCGSIKALFCER